MVVTRASHKKQSGSSKSSRSSKNSPRSAGVAETAPAATPLQAAVKKPSIAAAQATASPRTRQRVAFDASVDQQDALTRDRQQLRVFFVLLLHRSQRFTSSKLRRSLIRAQHSSAQAEAATTRSRRRRRRPRRQERSRCLETCKYSQASTRPVRSYLIGAPTLQKQGRPVDKALFKRRVFPAACRACISTLPSSAFFLSPAAAQGQEQESESTFSLSQPPPLSPPPRRSSARPHHYQPPQRSPFSETFPASSSRAHKMSVVCEERRKKT